MKDIIFYVGYEDELSLALIQKIFSQLNQGYLIGSKFLGRGAGYLKKNIKPFNELAKGIPFLLLTDLDNDECAPTKIRDWIKVPLNPNFFFRIAVKESESWVLADRESFSKFLNISINKIPFHTDAIDDPKRFLIKLVNSSSKNKLKHDIVPAKNSTASIGKNYNEPLICFIQEEWDLYKAVDHSESLKRMVGRLQSFIPRLNSKL
ncbi:MAG TPA: DUF4276 family protein [Candidatus Deferrimicrobium sp.]|nr:DUF4276 family protein [Candidatus Deferrimicrobium sp.]